MRILSIITLLFLAVPTAHAAPLTLQDAFRLALQNNKSLKAADEQLQQSQIQIRRAWTYLGPTVNGQIMRSWNNEVTAAFPYNDPRDPGVLTRPSPDGSCNPDPAQFGQPVSTGPSCFVQRPRLNNIVVRPAQSTTYTLSGNQPIFAGATIPALQAAWNTEELTLASIDNAREQVLYNVANLYYNVAAAEKFARLNAQSLTNLQTHLRQAEAKYAVGQIPRMGVLQAQIEVARAQATLARSRNDYQNALAALANLIGAGPIAELQAAEDLTAATFTALAFPSDATASAVKNRGDMKVAATQVSLAKDNKNLAYLKWAPNLILNGQIQRTDNAGAFGEKDSWNVALVLNVPLIQSGGGVFEVQDSYSKIRQAETQVSAKQDEIAVDVQTSRSRLDVTQGNLAVALQQANLAQENYNVTQISFENGIATSLDLIDANQTLLGAQINAIREQLNVHLDTLNYYRALGLLNEALGVEPKE